jgi:trk system potassium uptake protein TrkH
LFIYLGGFLRYVGVAVSVVRRVKAIGFSVSTLVLTLSVIALAIGVLGYVLSADPYTAGVSVRIVAVSSLSTLISLSVLWVCRGFIVTELLDAYVVVSLFWLLAPLFSTAIYLCTTDLTPLDAFFESLSGFSGTGLSVISVPESYPPVVLMWRAVTQWVGELGIVVVSGALFPFLHRAIRSVYVAERGVRLVPSVVETARRLSMIYVLYTAVGAVLLIAVGLDPFSSLAHSMTAIATGGMSTRSESLGYWFRGGNYALLVAASVPMVLGALNFSDLYNLTVGRLRDFAKSVEVRGLFTALAVLSTPLVVTSLVYGSADRLPAWLFHLVSALTTTGFSVTSPGADPDVVKAVTVVAMVVGGATFSTAGGIKIRRVAIALKSVVWEMVEPSLPRTVVLVKRLGSDVVRDDEVRSALTYVFLYLATLTAASVALHIALVGSGLAGFSYLDSLYETASALSCVGLSVGITATAPPLAKAILMICMYLGRIEFLPLYAAVGAYYLKRLTF